jgi:large subunit ribosomal protein L9
MKVILTENVAKVGRKYDIVDVAPGYARNFLLARNLAEAVTEKSAKRVAELQRLKSQAETKAKEILSAALKGGKGIVLTFAAKANEEGHLFAGIDRAMIAEKASEALNAEVTQDMIDLEKPVKSVGETKITISAHGQTVDAVVSVTKE